MDFIFFSIIGICTGFLAGLLGVGGGLVIVPSLIWWLHEHSFSHDHLMHVAIATSLAVIVVTSLSSLAAHTEKGTIDWNLVLKFLPGILLGTLIGAVAVSWVNNNTLKFIFSLVGICVALQMVFGTYQGNQKYYRPTITVLTVVGLIIGCLSAVVGVGGGVMIVPFLKWYDYPLRVAISTSAALGFPLSLMASLSFFVLSLYTATPLGSGYIYWPAFFSIAFTSVLFAPLGAKFAHRLPVSTLRRIFALFLALISLSILLI